MGAPHGGGHRARRAGRAPLTCPSVRPAQAAVALSFERELQHLGQPGSYFVQFPQAMQRRRDHMARSLQAVGLRPVIPQGSYFLITDISDFSEWAWPLPRAGRGGAWGPLGLSVALTPQRARCPTCPAPWMNPTTDASSSG